ncbi:MAG: hypothetical protein SGJ19_06135 [Planctomycetia bacterium]|nr:hypothetical protein [Planctomycetia bacterium]
MHRTVLLIAYLLALIAHYGAERCLAEAGTSTVASAGHEVSPDDAWPKGVIDLLNDPARTDGWNPWFSEWPNDVCHYGYDVQNIDDVNRLIEKFAKIETEIRQVHLSNKAEPDLLGWVTRAPEKNGIAVLYSAGDQVRVDQWYGHVRKPFGEIEFTGTPVAVPPTLTIFVGNAKIDLAQLKVPAGIEVSAGSVPGPFLQWNDKREQMTEEQAKQTAARLPKLSEDEQQAQERIKAFLKAR